MFFLPQTFTHSCPAFGGSCSTGSIVVPVESILQLFFDPRHSRPESAKITIL
jgi:hypothetical protein